MNDAEMPLAGQPPTEIPLKDAPLVRVIAQVKFPLIASVEKREFIAPFQEAIRRHYPVLRPEQSRGLVVGPEGGIVETRTNTVWRFFDASNSWRVTLAPDFLAIEATKYKSRDDFLERFEAVLIAVQTHFEPQILDRLGVRYIDRVMGGNLSVLPQLVRPEIAGVLGGALARHAHQSICENVFALPDGFGNLIARWGLVPPNGTFDPSAVEPIGEPSWLLDIDAFTAESDRFDVASVLSRARAFSERVYTFFRWAVTDEFLRLYGAKT